MATAIRVIPTLHGEEARKFIENAEWTEAHPGTCGNISKEDAQLLRNPQIRNIKNVIGFEVPLWLYTTCGNIILQIFGAKSSRHIQCPLTPPAL